MLRYILRRLAGAAVVFTLLSFLVFSLLYLVPGDPVKILVGTRRLTPEVRQAVTARYGLDEPLVVRYWHWLTHALTGDFGDSVRSATPVTDVLASRVSLTAWLTIGAFILAVAVGIPLGIAAARRRGSWVDRTIVGWSVVGVSAPGFALGLVLLYVFGLMLGWFPVFGEGSGLADTLWHLALPSIALATGIGAMLVRITRAAVGAELSQDYVTFARSRGVPSRRITAMYVRGAALPIITSAGLILGTLFGSTVLVEEAFSLPGLGQLLADSITYKDVPVVQAIALLVAFVIIGVTLIVDVAAFAVDPRQTIGEGRGA
jgi:peptide/nickel transport system permease protein